MNVFNIAVVSALGLLTATTWAAEPTPKITLVGRPVPPAR